MVIDSDRLGIAEKAVSAFDKRFRDYYPEGDHMQLIQLSAFPVAITVHLMYQLWANFNSFVSGGVVCKIDAMAVNDCILSNLFRQTGAEIYELEPEVRHYLLLRLRAERGDDTIKELANFLYQYSRHNTQGASWNNFYDAQQWAAVMEVDKRAAVNDILESLAREVQRNNTSRGIGIANLISTLQLGDHHFANLIGKSFYDRNDAGFEKQLLITNQQDGNSFPVSINLPPVLSNKLSKVLHKEEKLVEALPSQEEECLVYALLGTRIADITEMGNISSVRHLITENDVITTEDRVKTLTDLTTEKFLHELEVLLKRCRKQDYVFVYIDVTNALMHNVVEDIFLSIGGRLAHLPPIFLIIDGVQTDYSKFIIKSPGIVLLQLSFGNFSVFEKAFSQTLRNPFTYAEFYGVLLNEYITKFKASNRDIPLLKLAGEDGDRLLFSHRFISEADYLPDYLWMAGYDKADFDNAGIALQKFRSVTGITNERDSVHFMRKIKRLNSRKGVKITWLTSNYGKHSFKLEVANSLNQYHIWSRLSTTVNNRKDRRLSWPKLLISLKSSNFLFIGISNRFNPQLTYDAIEFLKSVAMAWNIELRCFLLDDFGRLPIPVPDMSLLLPIAFKENSGYERFVKEALRKEIQKLARFRDDYQESDWGTKNLVYGLLLGVNHPSVNKTSRSLPEKNVNALFSACLESELMEVSRCFRLVNARVKKADVIKHLSDILNVAEDDDVVLFYFCGFGMSTGESGNIMFSDFDLDMNSSEGYMSDEEFRKYLSGSKYDPCIVLILESNSESRRWVDENNPKHFVLSASCLIDDPNEFNANKTLTDIILPAIREKERLSYKDLLRATVKESLSLQSEKLRTPFFVVHQESWNINFLSAGEHLLEDLRPVAASFNQLGVQDLFEASLLYNKNFSQLMMENFETSLFERWISLERCKIAESKKKVFNYRPPNIILIQLDGEILPDSSALEEIERHLLVAFALNIPCFCLSTDVYRYQAMDFKTTWPVTVLPFENSEDVDVAADIIYEKTKDLLPYPKREIDISGDAFLLGIDDENETFASQNAEKFRNWLVSPGGGRLEKQNIKIITTGVEIWTSVSETEVYKVVESARSQNDSLTKEILFIYICGTYGEDESHKVGVFMPNPDSPVSFLDIKSLLSKLIHQNNYKSIILFLDLKDNRGSGIINLQSLLEFDREKDIDFSALMYLSRDTEIDSERTRFMNTLLKGLSGEAIGAHGDISARSIYDYLQINTRAATRLIPFINFYGNSYVSLIAKELLDVDIYCRFADEFIGHQLEIKRNDRAIEVVTINRKVEPFVLPPGLYTFSIDDLLQKTIQIPISHDPISVNLKWTFKKKWILVAGTRAEELSPANRNISRALGTQLAQEGYGLVTGDWPGVFNEVAKAYTAAIEKEGIDDKGYIKHIELQTSDAGTIMGKRLFDYTAEWYAKAIESTFAVVLIEGLKGTETAFNIAQKTGVPVIPLPLTEGTARKAYEEMTYNRTLPMFTEGLFRKGTTMEDATDIARVVLLILGSINTDK